MSLINEIAYRKNKKYLKGNIRIFIKKIESGELMEDDNVLIGLLEEDNKRFIGISDNFTVFFKEELGVNLKIKGKEYSQIENSLDCKHDSCTIPSGVLGWSTYQMKYAKGSMHINAFCQKLEIGSDSKRHCYNKEFKYLYRYLQELDKSYISIKELEKIKQELDNFICKNAIINTAREQIGSSVD